MTDDPKAWCFDLGLGLMQDIGGYTEKAARNRLGRLGKQYGYTALREALRRIRANRPREPMSYLTAVLKRLESEETGMTPEVPQTWQPQSRPRAEPNQRIQYRQVQKITDGKRVRADDPRWAALYHRLKTGE